jgi:hypothetical protein
VRSKTDINSQLRCAITLTLLRWHAKTTLRDVFHVTFSGLLLTVLTACGGGGGGAVSVFTASQSNPPPQILQSAPAPQEPFDITSTTLGASSGGNSYTAIYSETPNQGTTMFDGQEANSSTISLTITENGTPIISEIETVYYLENPYQPLGLTLSYNGGQFDFLYNSTNPLPTMLTIGGSGPLGSGTFYVVNSNNAIGSLTETYSVTWSNAWLLLNINATGTINGQSISQTIGYVLVGEAVMGVGSVEILVNGTTVHFDSACEGCWDD